MCTESQFSICRVLLSFSVWRSFFLVLFSVSFAIHCLFSEVGVFSCFDPGSCPFSSLDTILWRYCWRWEHKSHWIASVIIKRLCFCVPLQSTWLQKKKKSTAIKVHFLKVWHITVSLSSSFIHMEFLLPCSRRLEFSLSRDCHSRFRIVLCIYASLCCWPTSGIFA